MSPRDLPPSPEALALHAAACARGAAGYLDPVTGLYVLSSAYLLRQGRCCGQGCRHCPWPADVQARAGRPDRPAWPHA
ncbi:MAG: hypothetical protein KF878_26925 [Planctomycetes bacterium]|nr:hypothetical protein [Planctomycetota bacterium]